MLKKIAAISILNFLSIISVTSFADEAQDAGLPPFPSGSTLRQTSKNSSHCTATRNGVNVARWMTREQCAAWFAQIQALPRPIPSPSQPAGRDHNGMPMECNSRELVEDVKGNLPDLLDLGPDAASIVAVTPIGDSFQYMIYPSVNQSPARYSLTCQLQVKFSNGLVKYGVFEEGQDEYGQILVKFHS